MQKVHNERSEGTSQGGVHKLRTVRHENCFRRQGFVFCFKADFKLCSRTVWQIFYLNTWVYKIPHTNFQDQVTEQHAGLHFLMNKPQYGGRPLEEMTTARHTPKARFVLRQKHDGEASQTSATEKDSGHVYMWESMKILHTK